MNLEGAIEDRPVQLKADDGRRLRPAPFVLQCSASTPPVSMMLPALDRDLVQVRPSKHQALKAKIKREELLRGIAVAGLIVFGAGLTALL